MRLFLALLLTILPLRAFGDDILWGTGKEKKASAELAALPVALREIVSVADERLTLGDLFTGLTEEQEETVVSKSPALGKEVILDAGWLRAVAKTHKVNWEPKSEHIQSIVTRSSLEVTHEDVLKAFAKELASKGLASRHDITLAPLRSVILLPKNADYRLVFQDVSYAPSSYAVGGTLKVIASGRETHRMPLSGKAVPLVEVVAAKRNLSAGQIITADDIDIRSVREDEARSDKKAAWEDLLGKEVKKPLKAGRFLSPDDVRTKVMVVKGKPVTLSFVKGGVMLSSQGKAMENGGLGDSVRVMNIQSKSVVQGTVTGPEAVAVYDSARPFKENR